MSINTSKTKIPEYFLILILIFGGFYLRYFNLFLEDYWIDEIIGFAQANPNHSFKETLSLIYNPDTWDRSDQTPIAFHLLLKYVYKFFGYNPDYGRLLTLFLGTAVIPFALLITRELNIKNSSLLLCFFLCTNSYLIDYSQEVRPYILLFFISFLNIWLFLKIVNNLTNTQKFYIWSTILVIVNILGFLTHPFFLIIMSSEVLYCFINIIYSRKDFVKIVNILISSSIFGILIQYKYIINLVKLPSFWLENPNIIFITDFFFPRFFGSKIMGIIYLLTLIILFFKYRKKIFSLENYYSLFIIIIFLSYILPLIYGVLRMPILHDRYIIFILIPILTLISVLIYEINNLRLRKIVISILVIVNISHLYYELNYKTFYKPEVSKILTLIITSLEQGYTKNIYIHEETNPPDFGNYVMRTNNFLNNDFKF